MSKRTRFSAKTSMVTRCRTRPAVRRKRLAKSQESMAAAGRRQVAAAEECASRPKNNSCATLKTARSRANRRHHYRTNLIPRRNAFTDPDSRIMKSKEGFAKPITHRQRRRRGLDHCRARTHAVRQRSGPIGACHREQSRPQARAGVSGRWLLQRTQSQSARSNVVSTMSHLDAPSTRETRFLAVQPPPFRSRTWPNAPQRCYMHRRVPSGSRSCASTPLTCRRCAGTCSRGAARRLS